MEVWGLWLSARLCRWRWQCKFLEEAGGGGFDCSFLPESAGGDWNHRLLAEIVGGCSGCISLPETAGGGGSANCWKRLGVEVLAVAVALCKNLRVEVAVQVLSRGCRCIFEM